MATNTQINVGLRKNFSVGDRNFEDSGTVQYKALREKLEFLGTLYSTGDNLPMDGPGGTSYTASTIALLKRYWEAEWIQPAA